MTIIDEIQEYYGNEAVKYIPQIATGDIGRYNLMEALDCSEHVARTIIDKVKAHDQFSDWQGSNEDFVEAFPLLVEHCEEIGMPVSSVQHFWHKTEHFSIFSKPTTPSKENLYRAFTDIVEKHGRDEHLKFEPKPIETQRAIKATVTDAHVGLEPNPEGRGLFKYQYGPQDYKDSMEKVYQSIMQEYKIYGTFDMLLLDDLGDREDGWNGFTQRGGHELPQNMSNVEVFNTCVDTTVAMIRNLVKEGVANKYILRSCVNCNHTGDFAEVINNAVKKCIGMIYGEDIVEVQSLKRFMEHRFYGDHCFILTHGKDKKERKRGLPLKLNDKTVEFIRNYIDFYELERKAKYIHLEKGDLHQLGYDKHKKFDYRNFMSFAPPSNYLQHNYGDSYAGYSIQVIPKHRDEIKHTDYMLNYEKKNVDNEAEMQPA